MKPHEFGGAKDAAAGLLKAQRQIHTGAAIAGQNVVEVGGGRSGGHSHVRDGLPRCEKSFLHTHDLKCSSVSLIGQGERSPCGPLTLGQNCRMTWPQLDNFKARLKEYQAREKKTQPQVAADLGTTYGTLRFWLSGARKPKLASLQNAARVFGCSVTEFIDAPNIPTVQGDFSHRSEKRRFLLGLIVKDMGVESITDENLEAIIQAAYRERDWILARKARQNSGKP